MITRRAFTQLAAMLATGMGVANAQGKWQLGKHYRPVVHPQVPGVAAGKVEVAEFFWYGCGHCYALDPALEEWNAKKPDYIEFVRVPAMWGPAHRQHAKLYYTLQALQRLDLHTTVFNAIHREGVELTAQDHLKARAAQMRFLSQHGVTDKQFDAAYDSMSVSVNLQKAQTLTQEFAIASVPAIIIQGKFATSVDEAGGEAQLLALINDVAAGEKPR